MSDALIPLAGAGLFTITFVGLWASTRLPARHLVHVARSILHLHPGVLARLGGPRRGFLSGISRRYNQRIGEPRWVLELWVMGREGPATLVVWFVPAEQPEHFRARRVALAPWKLWHSRGEWLIERDNPLAVGVPVRLRKS